MQAATIVTAASSSSSSCCLCRLRMPAQMPPQAVLLDLDCWTSLCMGDQCAKGLKFPCRRAQISKSRRDDRLLGDGTFAGTQLLGLALRQSISSACTSVPASGVMHPPYQSVTGRRARLRRKAACSWLPQSSSPSITPYKAIETRRRREHSVQAQTFDPDSLDL